jgi:hypothetical protein
MSVNGSACVDEPTRIKISWSALQTLEFCSHKANLMRAGNKSATTDIRNFFHGNVCDRVMRAWLSTPNPLPGQMPGMVEEYILLCLEEAKETGDGVVRWRNAGDRAKLAEHCRIVLTGLEPMLLKWVVPYDYEPEHRFKVPIRIPYLDNKTLTEIYLTGGIDILVRESEVPEVWSAYDLKATADPNYLNKTLGQAIFYDLAIRAKFGKSPRRFAFLQPAVSQNPFADVVISDQDRMDMLARIVKVAHMRWRNEDVPKVDSAGCSMCPVKSACRKMREGVGLFKPVRASARR